MAFIGSSNDGAPMCDINTTPLVDVMLVLLIIFMITAPLMTNRTPVKLPVAGEERDLNVPFIRTIDILATSGSKPSVALDGAALGIEQLAAEMRLEAARGAESMAEINLRTAPDATYEHMAKTLALVNASGIKKIRFDELNAPGTIPAPSAQR